MKDLLHVGIIGCGRITELRHAPEYANNPRAKIMGFVDSREERAKEMVKLFGGKVYPTLKDMLADKGIDAVSVNVANIAHAEVAIAALDAGKHVLLEKPMAVTLKECENIVAAGKRNNRLVMLGHNQRFAKAHVKARDMIRSGAIGTPLAFRTTFGHAGPECWTGNADSWFIHKERAAFGVLADLGIHKTDLIHFLLEDPIVEVSAFLGTLDKRYPDGGKIDLEDNATCLYRTHAGVMGTLHVSWTFNSGEDNATRVYGTKGVLRMYDDPTYSLIFEPVDVKRKKYKLDELTSNEDQNAGKAANTGVIDAFVSGVLDNIHPVIDGEEALKAMRVIFAAADSAKTGKMVRVRQK